MTNLLIAVHHALLVTLAGMVGMSLLMAWLTNQDRNDLREDTVTALRVSGWKLDAVAAQTQTARTRLSGQLNGHAPCSFLGRLTDLAGFEVPFLKLRAKRHGLIVIEETELQRLVLTAQAFFAKRPVQKMDMEKRA